LDLSVTDNLVYMIDDGKITRTQHEQESGQRFFYKKMNVNHYFFYWYSDYSKKTYYAEGLCVIDLQKEVLIYKKKQFLFYRIFYIDGKNIMYYISKETLLDKTFLLSCSVNVQIVYPHFDLLKDRMSFTEYKKVTDLMCRSSFNKISNSEIEILLRDFIHYDHIESINENHL